MASRNKEKHLTMLICVAFFFIPILIAPQLLLYPILYSGNNPSSLAATYGSIIALILITLSSIIYAKPLYKVLIPLLSAAALLSMSYITAIDNIAISNKFRKTCNSFSNNRYNIVQYHDATYIDINETDSVYFKIANLTSLLDTFTNIQLLKYSNKDRDTIFIRSNNIDLIDNVTNQFSSGNYKHVNIYKKINNLSKMADEFIVFRAVRPLGSSINFDFIKNRLAINIALNDDSTEILHIFDIEINYKGDSNVEQYVAITFPDERPILWFSASLYDRRPRACSSLSGSAYFIWDKRSLNRFMDTLLSDAGKGINTQGTQPEN